MEQEIGDIYMAKKRTTASKKSTPKLEQNVAVLQEEYDKIVKEEEKTYPKHIEDELKEELEKLDKQQEPVVEERILDMDSNTLFVHMKNGDVFHISCDDDVKASLISRTPKKVPYTFRAKLHSARKDVKTFHIDLSEISHIVEG